MPAALFATVHTRDRGTVLAARLDRAVAAAVWRHRHPAAVATARLVGVLGDPAVAYPTAALTGPANLTVVGIGGAVRRPCCRRIGRSRPPHQVHLVPTQGASMPSKHTTLAVLAAGAVVRAAGIRGPARPLVPVAVGVAVGAGRVMLGAHWPADVAAGLAFGLAWWAIADVVSARRMR